MLENLRKKILYRAYYRGTREADLALRKHLSPQKLKYLSKPELETLLKRLQDDDESLRKLCSSLPKGDISNLLKK